MKRMVTAIACWMISLSGYAAHIIGGEMRYEYIGSGPGSTKTYRITMILFKGEQGAPFADDYPVAIYNNDNGAKIPGTAVNSNWLISRAPGVFFPVPVIFPSCITNPPVLNYTYAVYTMQINLPVNAQGYTVTYQTCCRINGIMNVGNSTGSTYNCVIPGTSTLGSGNDSSPQFGVSVNVVCKASHFSLDFSATDPDAGDSLVYSFCNAYGGGAATDAGFDDPAPPPYASVIYTSPYSGASPLGSLATINSHTGIISGIAPDFGKYVVCVCITVYRNGEFIATHRKDLIVQVSDCDITQSVPMPGFIECGGTSIQGGVLIQFNQTSVGANTYFWDFGDLTTLADTSLLTAPTYTYMDTGLYKVKLVINKGTGCADSATTIVGVYPGFFPGFKYTGSCFTNPYQFTDTTKANYGVVNSWSWNFGDLSTLADTAHIKNPAWTYAGPGPKTITFIVTSTKGCVDTLQQVINVLDRPPLLLSFKDTLICRNDAVTLVANGTGTFAWTPPVNITGANTATPVVKPLTTTWYYVTMNDNGCLNNDSVQVRVVPNVSLSAMPDSIICKGDAIRLHILSDGLQYNWTPAANLDDPHAMNPTAVTQVLTIYQVQAIIGGCSATAAIKITPIDYPGADAGPDPKICYNTSVQLHATIIGNSFSWSPTQYLSDPNSLNPVVTPPRTTQYILSVYDNKGCPKPGLDTITVYVNPKIHAFAGHDTAVVIHQPLQFNATGGTGYLWSPGTDLSNIHIHNPIGVYDVGIDSVRYKVIVTDDAGCSDSATVLVKVYKTLPSVFVPTAFTPNHDGLNEVIRPIAVGIQRLNYFSVYNRWGQLVFTTSEIGKGWDGTIGGKRQATGVFVWMVSAVDYLGQPIFRKGTVALIN